MKDRYVCCLHLEKAHTYHSIYWLTLWLPEYYENVC